MKPSSPSRHSRLDRESSKKIRANGTHYKLDPLVKPEDDRSLRNWLRQAASALQKAGVASARLDCLVLLEHVLEKNREWVLAHEDYELSVSELEELNNYLAQREQRTPLAYTIGSKGFYGYTFSVTPDVLIPRPESEILIEMLQEVVSGHDVNTIIDVGTGTGCLAITAKLLYPDVHVTAVDNSVAALRIAKKNARRHKVQIQFKQMDITNCLPAMPKTRPYIIMANLPYVPDGMVTSTEITKEPAAALFSGKDGLDHYRKLWQQIQKLKNKPIYILTESLEPQHTTLRELAMATGYELIQTNTLVQLFKKSSL